MKIVLNKGAIRLSVNIEHGNEVLKFNVNTFTRKNLDVAFDVFKPINDYWDSLDPATQDTVFSIYKRAEAAFIDSYTREALKNNLSNCVKELLDIHDLNVLERWVTRNPYMNIPTNLMSEYIEDPDTNTSREKTYLRSDYIKLLAFSLAMMCLVPIWGEYISSIRESVGTHSKEKEAFELLHLTDILKSEAYNKILVYVDGITGGVYKNHVNIIWNYMSSEDTLPWLITAIIIRKLSIGDIYHQSGNVSLVKGIFELAKQRTNPNPPSTEKNVRLKSTLDGGADEEDKLSIFDRTKKNDNLSIGEITELEFILSDPIRLITQLKPDVDLNLVHKCIDTASECAMHYIPQAQIDLLGWIYSPVVTALGMMYIDSIKLSKLMGAAQAMLWELGHKQLSLLVSSHPSNLTNVEYMTSKRKFSDDVRNKLLEVYPYGKETIRERSGSRIVEVTYFVIESINEFIDEIMLNQWRMTADEAMIQEVFGTTNRRFQILPDLKTNIALMLIDINKLHLNLVNSKAERLGC